MRKYRNQPTVIDNITFHSKREADHYCTLKLQQKAGIIKDLELQPSYQIEINGRKICKVILDFRFMDHARGLTIQDVKGTDTPVSKIKRKLVEATYGIMVELVR